MSAMTQFAERHGITAKYEETDSNPNMAGDERWAREATHYVVTLKHGKKTFTLYYSKGSALDYGVEPGEVLNALALDSSGIENEPFFDDWAKEYGFEYDENCIAVSKRRAESLGLDCDAYFKAKETFEVTKRQATRLKSFLGEALYRELLETESD